MRCGSPHPIDAERVCSHPRGERHANHNDGLGHENSGWPNTDFEPKVIKPSPSRKKTKSALGAFLANTSGVTDSATRVRTDDPDTSRQAALALGDLRPAQVEVHEMFAVRGEMTDEVLLKTAAERGSSQTPSGLRSRRDELVKGGLVVDTGRKAKTANNRDSIVWDLASRC